MIAVYCGDGKGKTTAAVGSVVRAAGSGMRVLFIQFLKNGDSSECGILRQLSGVTCLYPDTSCALFAERDAQQCAVLRESYTRCLAQVVTCAAAYDMIVLDEAIAACNFGLLDQAQLAAWAAQCREEKEILLTGRAPASALLEIADYVSEIHAVKHPFSRGVAARRGIEF